MAGKRQTAIIVNGVTENRAVEPRTHLIDYLRDECGLTGAHAGCEHGVCGACTVEIDGAPARSCIQYAVRCEGATVRTIEGFGIHTFRFVNAKGKSTFVKFHWKPKLGLQSVMWNEAVKINGADPDFHRRDLWNAIQTGNFPEWELGVQIFSEDEAEAFSFDILDATKIVPEEVVPVRPIGRMVALMGDAELDDRSR